MTDDQRKHIQGCAISVWDEIGWDCLQATAECEEKSINHVTMSRDAVIEVVIDANRLEAQIERRDKPLAKAFGALEYKDMIAIVKPAFSHRRYGL